MAAALNPGQTTGVSASKKPKVAGGGRWDMKLFQAMKDPKQLFDDSDDKIVVIKDGYPKSLHHYLIIPRETIYTLKDLREKHLSLLEHMKKLGQSLVEQLQKENGGPLRFRMGYHAVTSMKQIHMHVISQDFNSVCLKHKKHYNSFTTAFFLDVNFVISELTCKGRVIMDTAKYEDMLKQPMICHVCKTAIKNIPDLKRHLKLH